MKTKVFNLRNALLLNWLLIILLYTCAKDEIKNSDNPSNDRTTANFNPDKLYGTVIDIDGNIYNTIIIGTQEWMAENLRTTHYQNGENIPEIMEIDAWRDLSIGALCNYQNTHNLDSIATYGRLYNWYAVNDNRKLAPRGWHIPSMDEWSILFDYLGGDSVAGCKLKESGVAHWIQNNYESINETGFTALPGGHRTYERDFIRMGYNGSWWSNTDGGSTYNAFFIYFNNENCDILNLLDDKLDGRSVRCLKD